MIVIGDNIMPDGYIFLGSGDKDFDERFTLDHFILDEDKRKDSPELYDLCLKIINNLPENMSDEEQNKVGYNYVTNKVEDKQISYAVAHCAICKKIRINNSFRYCWPCEYCYKRLKFERGEPI